ncbi:GFA family protein [Agaribacterium sp. ZY112]|uniref:GFA family protein n=1 Tax=Agaribacterium sp. ZY112 TaxID=3233574 RepID=UPI003524DEEE
MVDGTCLCGKISYKVELLPNMVFNCHCQYCRKAHGAAYATMALANKESLTLADPSSLLTEHKNTLGGFRAFCSACGSRLMNYGPEGTPYLSIVLASVDSPIDFTAVAHCNTESKASWCEPYEGVASFPGFPEGF